MTPDQHTAFSEFCTSAKPDRESHPINCVDWHMANDFCRGKGGRLSDGGARLPSEPEWEFAARGSSQRIYPWGDDAPDQTKLNACGSECMEWFGKHHMKGRAMYPADDGFAGTAPVRLFPRRSFDRRRARSSRGTSGSGPAIGTLRLFARDEAATPEGNSETGARRARGFVQRLDDQLEAQPAYRWKTTPDVYNHSIGFRLRERPRLRRNRARKRTEERQRKKMPDKNLQVPRILEMTLAAFGAVARAEAAPEGAAGPAPERSRVQRK